MEGEDWSAEDALLAEELMLAVERQASSRVTSTSAPAAVSFSGAAKGRTVVTRSKARANTQHQDTKPVAQPEDFPAAAAEAASPAHLMGAISSNDDASPSLISPSRRAVEIDVNELMADVHNHYEVVPDVEEIGTVMDRRQLRPYGFSVTGTMSLQWAGRTTSHVHINCMHRNPLQ